MSQNSRHGEFYWPVATFKHLKFPHPKENSLWAYAVLHGFHSNYQANKNRPDKQLYSALYSPQPYLCFCILSGVLCSVRSFTQAAV